MKVYNMLNVHDRERKPEINTMPSETVPDQAMTLKEILDRFARGLSVGGARPTFYDEENTMPEIARLDLAERESLAKIYAEELQTIEKNRQEALRERQKSAIPSSPVPSPQQAPEMPVNGPQNAKSEKEVAL